MSAPDRTGQLWEIYNIGVYLIIGPPELEHADNPYNASWYHPAVNLDIDSNPARLGEWNIGLGWETEKSTRARIT
jgi:hypothetical protein